jgi:MFS family permease
MVGIIFSPLSDKYGRKPLLLLAIILAVVAIISTFLIKTFWAYYMCIIFIGISATFNSNAGYVYLVEITAKRY